MKMTVQEHTENAQDWLGASTEPMEPGETVNRTWLAEQMQYTCADQEDVEAIALEIERMARDMR